MITFTNVRTFTEIHKGMLIYCNFNIPQVGHLPVEVVDIRAEKENIEVKIITTNDWVWVKLNQLAIKFWT